MSFIHFGFADAMLSEPDGVPGAQSVELLTAGFGSGRDVRVLRWSPESGPALSTDCAWGSPSSSAQPLLCPSLLSL